MIRRTLTPRPDWRRKVEAEGLIWHGVGQEAGGGEPYWNESACYSFTLAEIETVEAATAELYRLFLAAGQAIVDDQRLLDRFGIPPAFHQPIRDAWNGEPPALNFGRFDLGYDGAEPPKLFEFNCDTPTSLLEAAVIQWSWKEEVFPAADQFNSLHERLVAKWRDLAPLLPAPLWFAHAADASGEDAVTTSYLRDTAEAAGLATMPILVDDLGWDADRHCFVDLDEQPIAALFKLYPWEWLASEAFAPQLLESFADTLWIEPVWKMIWSNKAILPILWQLFPGHPNLLLASFDMPNGDAVAKPLLAREGANVSIRRAGTILAETAGVYGEEGFLYQALYPLPETAPGCFPVLGSWIIDGEPAGMGIREDGLITTNTARFVPHVIEG
ncbi:glutathionylspermidine synthase family protein [Sphingomonas bacterium]|uniref:glutathionylspermidine synthase family protein n=1 Tax=Sphingomonas bacterium TaxID=1895847 RepID=UPI0015765675|nr:glutathionylspermidine synthase family protein [Sphingomonas bacterium]